MNKFIKFILYWIFFSSILIFCTGAFLVDDIIIYIVIALVLASVIAAAVMAATNRKPTTQQAQSLKVPQVTAGVPIRVIFGTKLIRDLQLAAYMNVKIKKAPIPTGAGGKK